LSTTTWQCHAASYGSTKRYKSVERIYKVNSTCVVGASGEISDFQQIKKYLEELTLDDYLASDGISITPKQVHSYLTRVLYNRRDKYGSGPTLHMFP
jgi:20S proteasome subunit beta 7